MPTCLELERFFAKVVLPPDPDDCWEWIGSTSRGYGYIQHGKKVVRAPRLVYQWFRGTPPPELVVDHLCNRPICVNPTHLQAITQRANTLRGRGRAARQAGQTHCIHGHDLHDAYIKSNGARNCRPCAREGQRERRRRKG